MALVKNKRHAPENTTTDWELLPESRTERRRGIFMSIAGLEGSGKSSLAMTLAYLGKLAYVDIDKSADRAKRPDEKKVREGIRTLQVNYTAGLTEEMVKANCSEAWWNMTRRVEGSMEWARGVVLDTETETWELKRLASFGAMSGKGKRMDRVYGPVNAQYRQFLRNIYRNSEKHLITVHQLKDDYIDKVGSDGEVKSIKTGKLNRTGFKEIGYLADIAVECFRGEEGEFRGRIKTCKLAPNGPMIEGLELEEDQLTFASIVALATDTEPDDWR